MAWFLLLVSWVCLIRAVDSDMRARRKVRHLEYALRKMRRERDQLEYALSVEQEQLEEIEGGCAAEA